MSSVSSSYIKANLYKTDEEIVRHLAHTRIYRGKRPTLSPSRIEKRTRLSKIPKTQFTERVIGNAVGEFESQGIDLEGRTLKAQVDALLSGIESEYKDELHYFYSRVIIGNLPRDPSWAINQQDLDHFSASLFILHQLSTGIGCRVNWNRILREPQSDTIYRTRYGRTIPRPDSALLGNLPIFLKNTKDSINVISFEPLRKICEILSRKNEIQLLGRENVSKLLHIPISTARYRTSILDLAITERFLPNYSVMGLRQRWVQVTVEPDDLMGSRQVSPGLIRKFNLDDSTIPVAFLQLEPTISIGPRRIPGTTTFTTDYEAISFRLDRFDNNQMTWSFDFWVDPKQWAEKQHVWHPRKKSWLYRSSDVSAKPGLNITRNQANLISALVINQGSSTYRRLLLELLGIKKTAIRGRIDRLLKLKILSILYHPLLDYSGLPEAVLLQVPDILQEDRKYLMTWLMGAMPYTHFYWGKDNSLVVIIRVPRFQTGMTISPLREFLTNGQLLSLTEDEFLLTSITDVSSYYLSIPERLHDHHKNQWRDPWLYT